MKFRVLLLDYLHTIRNTLKYKVYLQLLSVAMMHEQLNVLQNIYKFVGRGVPKAGPHIILIIHANIMAFIAYVK